MNSRENYPLFKDNILILFYYRLTFVHFLPYFL